MREILGATYQSAMGDINQNILHEHANHVLVRRDDITPEEFHAEMDRLIYERDTLMVEIAQIIIDRRNDPQLRPLVAMAAEAKARESANRKVPGFSFDLPFVQNFFGKLVDVRNN